MVQRQMALTTDMYNIMMLKYLHENDLHGAYKVVQQMEDAKVVPNQETFNYLISNCTSEGEINKLLNILDQRFHIKLDEIVMALIYAYTACGQFEKAKQEVLSRQRWEDSYKTKTMLVSTLVKYGKLSDAVTLYKKLRIGAKSYYKGRSFRKYS